MIICGGFALPPEQALGIMSLGENIPASVYELAKLSDEMWFLAGCDSYNMNWYTKRAMLSGIYASTGEPIIAYHIRSALIFPCRTLYDTRYVRGLRGDLEIP